MFEQAFKNIDDVLRKEAGCTTELDYTEQTSWLLFLKYLDGLEQDRATEAKLNGKKYSYSLEKPYRWETWAAPKDPVGNIDHNRALSGDDLRDFVNGKLQPSLKSNFSEDQTLFLETLPRNRDIFCKHLSPGDESASHPNPESLRQVERNPFNAGATIWRTTGCRADQRNYLRRA